MSVGLGRDVRDFGVEKGGIIGQCHHRVALFFGEQVVEPILRQKEREAGLHHFRGGHIRIPQGHQFEKCKTVHWCPGGDFGIKEEV